MSTIQSDQVLALQINESRRFIDVFQRTNQIAGSDDPQMITAQMLDLMLEVSQAETALFFIFDPSADELVIAAIRGDDESLGLIGMRLKKNLGIIGAAVTQSYPIIVGDLPGDPRWLRIIDPKRAHQLTNTITFPLHVGRRLAGVVQIYNYQSVEPDLLMALGERLAGDLTRVMQIKDRQTTNDRLNALINILGQVAGTMDRDRLLQLVTEGASKLVDANRSSIYLVEKESEDLSYQVSFNAQENGALQPERGRSLDEIFQLLPLQSPIMDAGEHSPTNATYFTTHSALSVPLKAAHLDADTRQNVTDENTIGGLLALNKRGDHFNAQDAHLLKVLGNQTSTFLQVAELYEHANDLFLDVLKALVAFIDAKDTYTQGHSLRVSELSVGIAEELGLDRETINDVRIGSLLHDVGKIGIPDHILKKKGRLTAEEYTEMKNHPKIGKNVIGQVRVLQNVLPAIHEHHERLDGSGYPLGLRGDHVSLLGRIVAVADVYDAMTTDRPYRDAIAPDTVLAYLHENACVLFDTKCVNALNRTLHE